MPFSRNKKSKSLPPISTASLPDIIFMLLFFFMVVTVLRENDLLLKIQLPHASEVQKLQHKSLVNHIHIGKPIMPKYGNSPKVQINDAFVKVEDIGEAVKYLDSNKPEYLLDKAINSLKIDGEMTMGVITEVKTELRKADKLKVNYAAVQE